MNTGNPFDCISVIPGLVKLKAPYHIHMLKCVIRTMGELFLFFKSNRVQEVALQFAIIVMEL